jgi:hypothetical protein
MRRLIVLVLLVSACESRHTISAPCLTVVEQFTPPRGDTLYKVTVDSTSCPRR